MVWDGLSNLFDPQLCLLLLNNIYFLQFLNESEKEIKMLQKLALVQRKGHIGIYAGT